MKKIDCAYKLMKSIIVKLKLTGGGGFQKKTNDGTREKAERAASGPNKK